VDLEDTAYLTVTKANVKAAILRAPLRAADNRNGTCSSLGVIGPKPDPATGTVAFTGQDKKDSTNAGTATLTRSGG
jgi:hypothetical protein